MSESLGKTLPFDSLAQLRAALYESHPHFAELDEIAEGDAGGVDELAKRKTGSLRKAKLRSSVEDFYLTNPIARSSAVMAECSARAKGTFSEAAE